MKNYRIRLGYDGTDFKGWQRQPGARTVQGVLEEALFKVTRKKTAVHGAGRTDAGVHALGQVASFRGAFKLSDPVLLRALNAVLPEDVRVFSLGEAPPEFHARRSARSKLYRYRIARAAQPSPLDRRYVLHWPYPLRIGRMRRAARLFARTADFTAFSSNRDRSPVRTVTRSELRVSGDEILYTIEASGFLRYMVRTIVGTLLEVGRGRLEPEGIEEIFRCKDRSLAGATAAAKGLTLVRVDY
ncbi:MAG TPA: tRNA pseudouridine(38-40) synthase TruA [Candidatus Aminicenantes bacterium]|nr:tRNA pseudouridine(38-40) synthase TruA [Candidatus Aminicenantes bacterium]HRY65063.1 tRNA pseudouridine(38-40) synthase TruA [Candidatus Aminicenantes bacterium]HRZ71976.1 tRNA pseudouridine(38-40) synthase TruA [Candidatus Aminicenantes bacterium]